MDSSVGGGVGSSYNFGHRLVTCVFSGGVMGGVGGCCVVGLSMVFPNWVDVAVGDH